MTTVLGIETSCDETSVAIYDEHRGLWVNETYSQIEDHAPYGGVVPELAARDHVRKLLPLVNAAWQQLPAGHQVDAVAYTAGPGLVGSLMVGATMGRTLAWRMQCPALPVNHLEGHILAPMLEPHPPEPPFLALLVSGGHTLLIEVKAVGNYRHLGESVDDAAGEAFDKVAQLLGLGYPGGPAIAQLAKQGTPGRFHFPRPMLNQPNFNFSFSGLKTHALYRLQEASDTQQNRADLAYAFQQAVVETLVTKCQKALDYTRLNRLVVAGGVGANQHLRAVFNQRLASTAIYYPRIAFCTDNAAMIAYTGWQNYQRGKQQQDLDVWVKPKWPLSSVC